MRMLAAVDSAVQCACSCVLQILNTAVDTKIFYLHAVMDTKVFYLHAVVDPKVFYLHPVVKQYAYPHLSAVIDVTH